MKALIRKIYRRSLWRVLGIYVFGSWIVLQAVDTLTGVLQLPAWFPSFALVLVLVGLPLVLATAFLRAGAEEPSGSSAGEAQVSRPSEDRPTTRLDRALTLRNAIVASLLAFALWGVAAAMWIAVGRPITPRSSESNDAWGDRPAVAVLPLANRSALESDAYFTDGIHEEILTQLAKISDLKVISRTSVMGYRNTEKNVRQIGQELGAEYLLEGGLLRAGDQVRLNLQLIHAPEDDHVWAESYDRDVTVSNLFAIQTDIARQVAGALLGVLSPEEEALIAAVPTENVEAYDFYLRGRDWLNRGGLSEEEYRFAAQMYEQAIELDPDFALAYAKLSSAHVQLFFQGHDRSAEQAARAKSAVDRAVALAPDHPEVHEALGDYYYYGRREYDRALQEYRMALEQLPGSATLIARIAWVQRRKGQWDESLVGLRRVLEMDPRSAGSHLNLAISLASMRQYGEADEVYEAGLALQPEMAALWRERSINQINWRGSAEAARAVLADAPPSVLSNPRSEFTLLQVELFDRNYTEVLERLGVGTAPFESEIEWYPVTLLRAWAYEGLADSERANAAYDSARLALEEEARIRPNGERVQSALGYALAGLGRREEAIEAGLRGVQLQPVSRDAVYGSRRVADLAAIYVAVGEPEEAIQRLEYLLEVPAGLRVSAALLRYDPRFDPLRDHPRFQALLEQYESDPDEG